MEVWTMKQVVVVLTVFFVVFLSTQAFSERWDGATVDMSGSGSSSGSNICDQPRPIFDTGKAMMWDSLCGGNTQQPEPNPRINPRPDSTPPFDWEQWQRDFNRDWDNPADDRAARERYNREVKAWADDFSGWLIYSMPQYFNYHPDVAADLSQLRQDLYNPILRGRVQRCLSNRVANDTENIRNLMNLGDDDRLIGYHVMAINNCYRQVR